MYPTLGTLPFIGTEVVAHHAALIVAVAVCLVLGPLWAERLEGIPWRTSLRMIGWIGLAVFAGARAHYLWNVWGLGTYREHPLRVLEAWDGLHAGGAIAALLVSVPVVTRAHAIPIGRFADAFAPTVGIGIALARTGCFLNGCCFGVPCHAPWCVAFPSGSIPHNFQVGAGLIASEAAGSLPVHPLQVYFAGAGLLATAAALLLASRKRYDGEVALVALAVYLVPSAAAEFVRAEYLAASYQWAGVSQLVWVGAALAFASLMALAVCEAFHQHRQARSAVSHELA